MNCAGCPAPCCQETVYLTPREYEFLRKKQPTLQCTQVGELHMMDACPFLKEGRCAIYKRRPLACIRFPLAVKPLDNAVVLLLHHTCPQVAYLPRTGQSLPPGELAKLGITQEEYRTMLVANLILEAEIGRVWKDFTLKERNKMRIIEAKQKKAYAKPDVVVAVIPQEEYTNAVQSFADLLEEHPEMSYEEIIMHPVAELGDHT